MFTQNIKMVNKKVGSKEFYCTIKTHGNVRYISATSSYVFALLNCISDTFVFRSSAAFLGN